MYVQVEKRLLLHVRTLSVPEVTALPTKHQLYKALIAAGGVINTQIVIATAKGILLANNHGVVGIW